VVLVSKDLPLRVKAAAIGLPAQEYRAELAVSSGWTGMAELDVVGTDLDVLYDTGRLELPEARDLPTHTGVVLLSDRGSGLGRVAPDKSVRLVRGDRDAFGVHGRSAEQRIAIELLLDPEIGIVSLGGRAGTGKSALALCAGLESVLGPLGTGRLRHPGRTGAARGRRGGDGPGPAGGAAAHAHPRSVAA